MYTVVYKAIGMDFSFLFSERESEGILTCIGYIRANRAEENCRRNESCLLFHTFLFKRLRTMSNLRCNSVQMV